MEVEQTSVNAYLNQRVFSIEIFWTIALKNQKKVILASLMGSPSHIFLPWTLPDASEFSSSDIIPHPPMKKILKGEQNLHPNNLQIEVSFQTEKHGNKYGYINGVCDISMNT